MSALPSTDDLPAQVLELLSHGGGLGTIFGYTDDEYEALYALGHNHYSQQRYLDAAKCFGFLVAHKSLEPRFMNAFASCMQMLKRYQEAIQYYSTASVLDLEDPLPTFHTAECFIALEMPEQAREALVLVIAQCRQPQWEALRQRAQALLKLLAGDDAQPAPTGKEHTQ
ncbi:SycD/LcrH family type III secretion system chaperone [Pantoea sp. 18069]|uniref:SycD/LcrH family type III secretion system chaperone n=1 Tax=Pantoea sp. 18069 TaxID=2681415 RepID=UPI001359AB5E|nr:SycD/LcrH family type III secretion system chaperone [Pantoea sp. 18069]